MSAPAVAVRSPTAALEAVRVHPDGLLRIEQICGSPRANIPALIPVSRSTWWRGVKDGRYPKPQKLGPKLTCWRASEILALIEHPHG